jgi:hypothetical protein
MPGNAQGAVFMKTEKHCTGVESNAASPRPPTCSKNIWLTYIRESRLKGMTLTKLRRRRRRRR